MPARGETLDTSGRRSPRYERGGKPWILAGGDTADNGKAYKKTQIGGSK